MKRLFVFAAAAASLMAISCQKTYVVDEVNTPIGFSADLGKQTKAIMDDATYKTDHTFGVFAYALTDDKTWALNASTDNEVMSKVKIKFQDPVWRAAGSQKYYWPNDSETHLNFFMFSPYDDLRSLATVSTTDGLTITDYVHENTKHMGANAVDMMVASAKDKNYTNVGTTPGTVDFSFGHKMTQVVFVVKKDPSIDGATITLNSLDLLSINNKGTYKEVSDAWTIVPGEKADFSITATGGEVLASTGITLEGATMLPQDLTAGQQKINIVYSISGTGFANETVTKTFDINNGTLTSWGINQKITYTLTIKMNEILFAPTVSVWDDSTTGTIEVPAV